MQGQEVAAHNALAEFDTVRFWTYEDWAAEYVPDGTRGFHVIADGGDDWPDWCIVEWWRYRTLYWVKKHNVISIVVWKWLYSDKASGPRRPLPCPEAEARI